MEILPESDPKHKDALTSLLESAKEWQKLADYPLEIAIERFMNELGHLYVEYFQHHIEEAKECAIDYHDLLPTLIRPIETNYLYQKELSLNSADEWDDAVWERACWVRTNVEAFYEMFGHIARRFNDEDLLEFMENQKGNVRLLRKQIPKNAPKSHWWWFADYEGGLEL